MGRGLIVVEEGRAPSLLCHGSAIPDERRTMSVSVTVAFPKPEVNIGEEMFRRITFCMETFQACMERAEEFGWHGRIVHLKLPDGRTVILTKAREDT